MAMNGDTLGDEILAELDSAISAISDKTNMSQDDRKEMMRAIGRAIVAHIQANAVASGIDAPTGDTHALTIS